MELAQVRYFISLCQTLNFTKAAEQCNVTQPALTRSIQRLEAEFGGLLLFRERNMTQLTELGRTMRPHLEAMLDAADAARALVQAKSTRSATTLSIGLGPGVGAADVARAVRKVTTILPDVTIHFEESGPDALVEAMLTDRIDCALLPDHFNIPERINRWPLYTDRAVVVMPTNHKLMARSVIRASDIMDETILLGERCGDFVTRLLEVNSHSLRVQRCHGSTSQILDLISAGLGIALLSDRLMMPRYLCAHPFHEPEIVRRILLTVVAGRPLNPAATRFVKLCRAEAFDAQARHSLVNAGRNESFPARQPNASSTNRELAPNIGKEQFTENFQLPVASHSKRRQWQPHQDFQRWQSIAKR